MDIQLLRKRQKELKLTYQQLADKAGVSKRTIEDIFRGFTTSPRIDTVQAIEKALGIDNTWTSKDYENGIIDTKKVSITADQEDVLDKYKEVEALLGEKGKNIVIEFCDVLIEKFKR